jgi:hypothetical protein
MCLMSPFLDLSANYPLAHKFTRGHTFRECRHNQAAVLHPESETWRALSRFSPRKLARALLLFLSVQKADRFKICGICECSDSHRSDVLCQGTTLQAAESLMRCVRARLYRLRKASCVVSGHDFTGCGKPHALCKGTTLQAAESLMRCVRARLYRLAESLMRCVRARLYGLRKASCVVSGHDFTGLRKASCVVSGTTLQACGKPHVLCQGPTLVGP